MTRYELTKKNVSELKRRFGALNDAMIVGIEFDLVNTVFKNKATVTVNAPDYDTLNGEYTESVRMIFEFEGLIEYVVKQVNDFRLVQVIHLNVGFFDESICIDYCTGELDESSIDSFQLERPNAKNQLMIASKKCYWTVLDN